MARPFESSPPSLGPAQPSSPSISTRAFFEDWDTGTLVLFREHDTLKLWTGRQPLDFNDLHIVHHREGHRAWLTITHGRTSQDFTYLVDNEIEDDSFTMSEAEDFDFGLFLTNIHSDPQRQDILFQFPLNL